MSSPPTDTLELLVDVLRRPDGRRRSIAENLAALSDADPREIFGLLRHHQLGPLWLDTIERASASGAVSAELLEALRTRRSQVVAEQLLQERAYRLASTALESEGIDHVAYKGFHLARTIYARPELRPAHDVDLLVSRADFLRALRVLAQSGFSGSPSPEHISHEIDLTGHGTDLDLHRELLRPGRAASFVSGRVLASRVRAGDLWAPGPVETTLVLLVHPAVTKHVSRSLARAIDLLRWFDSNDLDLDRLARLLESAGLCTAAWTFLHWATSWLGPISPALESRLEPPSWRRSYLESWLRADPARQYERHPRLVRVAFSLALEDRPRDVVRSLAGYAAASYRAAGACRLAVRALDRSVSG